jgi:hypothetical protein
MKIGRLGVACWRLKNKELGVDLWVMGDVGIEKVWCGLCLGWLVLALRNWNRTEPEVFLNILIGFFHGSVFSVNFFWVFCSPLGVAIRFRGINHVWRYKFCLRVQVLFRRTCDQFTDKGYKVWTKDMVSPLRRDARSI